MKNYLVLLLVAIGTSSAFAQKINSAQMKGLFDQFAPMQEGSCNFAGTFTPGQFIGQSNYTNSDTIYLCLGDSLQFVHNNDADLSGDPQPATAAGVTFGYYQCVPTVNGANLSAILSDNCILDNPPPASGIYVTQGMPNGGDTWFYNLGDLQTIFNVGNPFLVYFAPITIDDWALLSYESGGVGQAPGPCVHVNTDAAFPVVYLNQVRTSQVETNFLGNQCIGKFNVAGGYPQFNVSATYDIQVSMASDPEEHGILHLPERLRKHQTTILFSVNEPAVYNVSIEDGIGCGLYFQMDMSGCDASENIHFSIDTVAALPDSIVCTPIRVEHFEVVSAAFSVNWNPSLLEYQNYSNVHPSIAGFFNPSEFLNISQTENGKIGIQLFDLSWPGTVIDIPEHDALLDLCFRVIDTVSNCTPVTVGTDPSILAFEDEQGIPLALSTTPGLVCPDTVQTSSAVLDMTRRQPVIWPNPVPAGSSISFIGFEPGTSPTVIRLVDMQGAEVRNHILAIDATGAASMSLSGILPGIYTVQVQMNPAQIPFSVKLVILE
ncbi:MAG: T9SS type A sorting domain-containing protein [Saprospiraceae bacterium]|nr:T9SS type A sorting domain-containing protein [Saprospiraceae bacterium]